MLKSPMVNIPIFLGLLFFLFLGHASSAISQEVGAWTNLGLYGGHIYDIAIDPSNPENIFAGSYIGDGLFRTTDGGSSWQPVETGGEVPGEDDFKNHANYAVKIAPSDSNVIWVAHNYWVEKSIDGGQTWTHILNSTMQRDCANCGGQDDNFRFCQAIAIDPLNPQIVYVATAGPKHTYHNGAIYKTEDGGQTWTKLNGGSDLDFAVEDLDIDPQDSSIIWAVTSSHGFGGWRGTLYRSGNGGDTWTPILPSSQSYTLDSEIVTVAVHPENSNTILTGSGWGIVRFFMDGSDILDSDKPCSEQGCYLNKDITFDKNNPNIAYTVWLSPQSWGGDGIGKVGRSIDGGTTWTAYSLGSVPSDTLEFKTITVHPSDSEVIYAGEFNEGIFKSLDYGQTWTPVSNGISAVIVYDIAVDPNDSTHIIAGTFSGTYEKKGSGDWSQLIRYTTRSVQFHPTDSQTIYAGLEGWFAKTTDSGFNWNYTQVLGPDLGSGPDTYNYVSDIAIDYLDTDTIFISVNGFGCYGQIQKSADGGASFVKVLDGVNQSEENYPFNVVAIDPSDHQHVFAGGGSFFAPEIPGDLWESNDGGNTNTWYRTSLQNEIVNAIIINPVNSDIIYAGVGYSGGTKAPLHKSIDGGINWFKSYDGISLSKAWNAVTDLEFHPENTKVIYASTLSRGVYISPNQGKNWLNIETPKYNVFAISTSSLYAATQGGLLQCTGTGLIAGQVRDALSQKGIHSATVFNDLGAKTITMNGEYMMVSPSGTCVVTAIADGYAGKTAGDITVYGGDVTWADIAMEKKVSEPSTPEQESSHSGRDDYRCFIATAAYGSPMAEQVRMLRSFRDKYLLPRLLGKKLVSLYYTAGKPAAQFIESHPSLKWPVRIILYPMVGLAWLLLSANAFTKGVIIICMIIGGLGAVQLFLSGACDK